MNIDRSKTLDELEGTDWGPPEYDSRLVKTCHRLRKTPLKDFSVEDLRIMMQQGISPLFLVPMALDVLQANPLAEGDYYPGDLLNSVVSGVLTGFWKTDPSLLSRLKAVVASLKAMVEKQNPSVSSDLRELLVSVSSSVDKIIQQVGTEQ